MLCDCPCSRRAQHRCPGFSCGISARAASGSASVCRHDITPGSRNRCVVISCDGSGTDCIRGLAACRRSAPRLVSPDSGAHAPRLQARHAHLHRVRASPGRRGEVDARAPCWCCHQSVSRRSVPSRTPVVPFSAPGASRVLPAGQLLLVAAAGSGVHGVGILTCSTRPSHRKTTYDTRH